MRILWVKTELLHPIDKGGRIRTYQMLRSLRKDHHVTYLCLDNGGAAPDAVERASEYCHELERVPFHEVSKESPRLFLDLLRNVPSSLPYAVQKYRSPLMQNRVRSLASAADILVCDFLFPSQNVPTPLPCPTLLFQHNIEADIWKRHTAVARSWIRRRYFGEQWRRMEAFERAECRRLDHVTAVSEADADGMKARYGLAECTWVPTGVDTEYFRPVPDSPPRPNSLVFTGALDWMPNQDAMQWFISEVLPLVRRSVPDVTLTVVGRNPTAGLRALAAREPGVALAGSVPDVRPYMAAASAFVVPMRIGGGTRLKIYEAIAMELPVVTTTIGAEGLPLTPGQHAAYADEAGTFAEAVVKVLQDRQAATAMAGRAAGYVRREFGWDGVARRFAHICEDVVAQRELAAGMAAAR